MGQHYWRTSVHGTVQDNFPYFLLYDQYDRLNQFGIAIATPTRVRRRLDNQRPSPPAPTVLSYPEALTLTLTRLLRWLVRWWPQVWPDRNTVRRSLTNADVFGFLRGGTEFEYPVQPLIPQFHAFGQMPMNILHVNTLDGSEDLTLPCASVATVTLHITLRDPSDITAGACEIDRSDPQVALDGPTTTKERILEAYGQPEGSADVPGTRTLKLVCDSQDALAGEASNCSMLE